MENQEVDKKLNNEGLSLEDQSVKELQQELVRLGMPVEDAEGFITKKPIIATIKTLQALRAVGPELSNPQEDKQVQKKWTSKADQMRTKLLAQPTMKILV